MPEAFGGERDRERVLRLEIVAAGRALVSRDLTSGRSGNVSARWGGGFLITPSGVPYDALRAEDVVRIDDGGNVIPAAAAGLPAPPAAATPSSEWRLHRALYAARPDARAIVHAHPPHSTALACMRRGLPAFHYMVAVAGGEDIRCATYATFGTEELARSTVEALRDRRACLLANHGSVALGVSPQAALDLVTEVESLARQYLLALAAGGPVTLSPQEMAEVLRRFRTYGQPPAVTDPSPPGMP